MTKSTTSVSRWRGPRGCSLRHECSPGRTSRTAPSSGSGPRSRGASSRPFAVAAVLRVGEHADDDGGARGGEELRLRLLHRGQDLGLRGRRERREGTRPRLLAAARSSASPFANSGRCSRVASASARSTKRTEPASRAPSPSGAEGTIWAAKASRSAASAAVNCDEPLTAVGLGRDAAVRHGRRVEGRWRGQCVEPDGRAAGGERAEESAAGKLVRGHACGESGQSLRYGTCSSRTSRSGGRSSPSW